MTSSPFAGAEPGTDLVAPTFPRLGKAETSYTYVDADGAPVFVVCRFKTKDGKTFRQGHPAPDGWKWNLDDIEPVLYRWDEVAAHLEAGATAPIYICEGEKDADRLRAYLAEHGLPGVCTCNAMGAGKWRPEYTEALRGARLVIVVADNDKPGREHAHAIAADLRPHVDELRLLRPALDHPKADLTDHLDAGLAPDALDPLDVMVEETPLDLAAGPLLMTAAAFVALDVVAPPPLWGTEEHSLLVEGGLAIFAGRPGVGKTTAILDLLCHLAAGLPWPPRDEETKRAPDPWPVPRPLRIALIENEGPIAMFRDKLRRKLEVFGHPIDERGGYLGVQTWRWGAFSFADPDAFRKASEEFEDLKIDLVVGDPLNLLGVEGVGSPDDTRRFVQTLRGLGLGLNRAFLLIHHFRERVDTHEDEVRKLSGAWSGHLDSLITLAAAHAENEARLAFPKLRWARGELPKPVILGRVYKRAGFEALGIEDDVAMLEPKLVKALEELREQGKGYGGLGWQTSRQLAEHIKKGKTEVPKALEAGSHLFVCVTGEAAKDLNAKANAKLWGLRSWDDSPGTEDEPDVPEPETQAALAVDPGVPTPADEDGVEWR